MQDADEEQDYQWGFSFLQLFVDLLLLLAWAIGIWVLWLQAHSELRRKEIEASNRYRSVLDLAAALNRDMATIGESADAISNQQLARLAKTRLHGVAVKAIDPVPSARYTYWTWIKERKGWASVYLLTATWVVPWFLVNFLVAGTSISVALSVGRTSKTKVLLFISVFIASSLLLLPFLSGGNWSYIIDPIGFFYSG